IFLQPQLIITLYEVYGPILKIPRTLMITDVFYEKTFAVSSGSNTTSCVITCPYPILNISVQIIDTNREYLRINSLQIFKNNLTVCSIDRRQNFTLWDGVTDNNET